MPLETLLALNYNTFILTVGIKLLVFILMLETCMVTVIVNCWKYHPRINYYNIFRVLIHVEMRIYMSLKVYIHVYIANFEVDLCLTGVEYWSISNINSLYQCSCKQCCAIAVYARCCTLLLIHVDTGLQELYLSFLVIGILFIVYCLLFCLPKIVQIK